LQGRYLHTRQHNTEFEPTIPTFEQAKTVHALSRAATAIGRTEEYHVKFLLRIAEI
jgi:hypothetical protein